MLIYTSKITPRLHYVADFLGKEIIGKPFELTTDRDVYASTSSYRINYSSEKIVTEEFCLTPHSLLFETGIKDQAINVFEINGCKAFFKTDGELGFDIFAASFYLLSRYEEYCPHQKDSYGRYAHENSLAFQETFLDKPLINFWIKNFKEKLKQKFPSVILHNSSFTFLPTYDIDIAWSYKHKGWQRGIGGLASSLGKFNWRQAIERLKVVLGKKQDPFDSYGWLHKLHQDNHLEPYYFFLLAERNGRYDKNISPDEKSLQSLISDHNTRYTIGIHPSWRSGDENGLLKKEIETLAALTGNKVLSSRQHYIRFILPDTFRRLLERGIKFDFSMGYGSINGFRASVATPFYWYDLEKEQTTNLMLFPFCFMEANSFYEQKYSAQQALDEMRHYYEVVKSVNGTFIMIWHNHFLGTDELFTGWKEVYEQFIAEIKQRS